MADEERVSIPRRFAYAAPAFALAVVGIPVYVYIPKFYTDVVGINVAVLGYLILAVRIFDAVSDPIVGVVSDRTRTPFGRRRPYIAGAAIPLALALWMLCTPPVTASPATTWWFAISIFALFVFWTGVTVPYESLGPEITFNYEERTALLGTRDGFLIAGTLVAASSPAAVAWLFDLGADATGERARFAWIATLYGPLIVILCWWCAFVMRERPGSTPSTHTGLFSGLRTIRKNHPFLILVTSYTVSAFGSNLPATLILFYVTYVLRSDRADAFLVLYLTTGVLFLPGWVWVARRLDKKRTWLTAMAINSGAFAAVFFLGPGDRIAYGLLVFLSGIGFGATVAMPSSMQADVIDYDELLSGERREGQYIGLWAISRKLAAALGVGMAFPILGAAGYEPNVEQTPEVQFVLRTLYALVPSLCNVVAFIIALAYPINRARHAAIRAGITIRRQGGTVDDPLHPGRQLGPGVSA